ncbi:UPF0481 protein At3g47200-like [Arachis duranensis]|uniref:UPF0481 protein At3g47200-like n=1 Tax=Arachis duranensis TaxID=130453 RepID=A0A6P4DZ88_ARADU|nr:UPF0481 protein At3g47200-like [Arachis duranensis]XP_052107655.1 UPF0481 protein At3g47200-like [Arachis duranensis]
MANPNPGEAAIIMKIKAKMEKALPLVTDECCIYRVPREIRKLKEDAYTPKVVSIGPFHHRDPNLQKMEGQKTIYFKEFIERTETKNLESFVSCVQELEAKVRDCYSDDIKLSEEEHVMVILVDCCFILEFLLKSYFNQWSSHDVFFLSPWLSNCLEYDLLMLENQVPFFVLEKLYNLAFPSTSNPSLLTLTYHILPRGIISGNRDGLSLTNVGRIAHFTDLTRKLLLLSSDLSISECSREAQVTHLYTATQLREAGVKFEVNKASNCLLDLQLSGHTLRIPFIRVEDSTEAVWRNLLAFEQCHWIDESYLADYIFIIDFLIDTDKDVDLLIEKGIIENWLGDSNAVATMFNGLAVNILTLGFNEKYSCILKGLNDFCEKPWNRKVATLKRDYCNTPWRTVASIAGIFLLILTLVQTIFSILQVVH